MTTASESDLKLFIACQLLLLSREKDAEVERTSLLISNCSHKLLEQRGLALGGLGVASVAIGLGGRSLIELERPSAYHTTTVFPPHTLRPGDLARIDEYSSNSSATKKSGTKPANEPGRSFNGQVSDVRIVLAVDSSSGNEELDVPERCTIVKLANTVTHDRQVVSFFQLQRLLLPNEGFSSSTGTISSPSNNGPNSLHRVLLGLSRPTPPPSASPTTLNRFFDSSLNASQVAAVEFCLNAPEVACIHGPPGTGKTRVLVEVIRQMVYSSAIPNGQAPIGQVTCKTPLKILVCGSSNLAVDNLLERLSSPTPLPTKPPANISSTAKDEALSTAVAHYPPIALTRLGHPARVMSSLQSRTLDAQAQTSEEAALVKDVKADLEEILGSLSGKGKGQRLRGEARKAAWQNVKELRKEYRKREEGVVKSVLSRAQVVVLATCHGASSRQLQNMEFDVVVIDEATQAIEAVCWIPVLKAKKLILAGDPMQLGPTIISDGNRRHAKHTKVTQKMPEKSTSNARKSTLKTESVVQVCQSVGTMAIVGESGETDNSSVADSSSETESETQADVPAKVTREQAEAKSTSRSLLRPPKSLATTMFDRLETMYGGAVKRMLDVQYRMNTKISNFPSKILYHSRLTSHTTNASRLLSHLPGVSQEEEYEDVVGTGSEVIFWDTAGAEFWERSGNDGEDVNLRTSSDDGGSLCNENEAEVVKRWVHRLMAAGVQPSQIAIITPYQAQSQILSTMLPEPGLEIGTADGMQGRENEAVVLSLVRSNPQGEVGFLKERRRLNVAMTRAKRHLCVVGDSSTIRRGGGKYLKSWMNWLEREADVRFAGDI
ncbi:AAA domain-containing protein [Gautieria morchelliformis]|nr:AAA domain-containing protein [Gautieria morchelliformis]